MLRELFYFTLYNSVVCNLKLLIIKHFDVCETVGKLVDWHIIRVEFAKTSYRPASCNSTVDIWLGMLRSLVVVSADCVILGSEIKTTGDVYRAEHTRPKLVSVKRYQLTHFNKLLVWDEGDVQFVQMQDGL